MTQLQEEIDVRVPAKYFPPSHRTARRRPPQVQGEPCPKCSAPMPEDKYHDCGEQLEMFDVDDSWRRPKSRSRR